MLRRFRQILIYFLFLTTLLVLLLENLSSLKNNLIVDYIIRDIEKDINNYVDIKVDKIGYLSPNKVCLNKLKFKKDDYCEIELFNVKLNYNLWELIKKSEINYLEFDSVSIKFNKFVPDANLKNKVIFKNINGKMRFKYKGDVCESILISFEYKDKERFLGAINLNKQSALFKLAFNNIKSVSLKDSLAVSKS